MKKNLLRGIPGIFTGNGIGDLLFFLLFYLYLWLVVDLRLIYHGGGLIMSFPVFYKGWDYFYQFVSYPGGPIGYAGAFLSQLFRVGWAGALVATVQAWLLWLCTGRIIKAAAGRRIRWVSFIAPILLLVIYGRYSYQFTIILAIAAALGFVCLYLAVSAKNKPRNFGIFLVLSVILYLVAGGAYLLFAAVCVLFELLLRRRYVTGLVYLVSVPVVTQVVALLVFDVSAGYILPFFQPFYSDRGESATKWVYALGLFVPSAVILLWLVRIVDLRSVFLPPGNRNSGRKDERGNGESERNRTSKFFAGFKGIISSVEWLVPLVMAGVVIYFSHYRKLKEQLEVDYYACRGMWAQTLDAAGNYPRYRIVSHAVNRALYHSGRLADDMFSYPQRPEALFLGASKSPDTYWRLFDVFFDLGQMNMAEYSLVICMETYGEQPMLLRRLAIVSIVKGNTGAARVYLGKLRKTLFDSGWAESRLEKLDSEPGFSTDEEIMRLRAIMVNKDRVFTTASEEMVPDLLERNKMNQMAYEYQMCFYLLTGELDKFAEGISRLTDFGYTRIPAAYEEAILLYSSLMDNNIELKGLKISPESRYRFEGFTQVYIHKYKRNREAAFDELSKNYGDSYLYYYIYQHSGVKG